jgi:predicted RNA-binding protein associated with RNAse of E/G family
MAISVDTVYQRVLAILNKEQRGYLTPVEFNLLANQAQMSIFEQYFIDISQFSRVPGNSTEYSDPLESLYEKIAFFEKSATALFDYSSEEFYLPDDTYKMGELIFTPNGKNPAIAQIVRRKDYLMLTSSKLLKPTDENPIAYISVDNNNAYRTKIKVHGDDVGSSTSQQMTAGTNDELEVNYIKSPTPAVWGYSVVLGEALYNQNISINFQIHPTDETKLVMKVLELAGLVIQDIGTYQVADKEDKQKIQQEKS